MAGSQQIYDEIQQFIILDDLKGIQGVLSSNPDILTPVQIQNILISAVKNHRLPILQYFLKESAFLEQTIAFWPCLEAYAYHFGFFDMLDEIAQSIQGANITTMNDRVLAVINEELDARYVQKKNELDKKGLDSNTYQQEIIKLENERKEALSLIDIDYPVDEINGYLLEFYDDFFYECLSLKPELDPRVVEKMFFSLLKEIYHAKLNLFDIRTNTDPRTQPALVQQLQHEGKQRVIWTQAQEELVSKLRTTLASVFHPLTEGQLQQKINLYTKEGGNRAESSGAIMSTHYPPAAVFDNISDFIDELFFSHSFDSTRSHYQMDYGLRVAIWSAISAEYVTNVNAQDVDVYLPEGELTTSSIFWNYELMMIKLLQSEPNKKANKINFYQLTPEAKENVKQINKKIEEFNKELKDTRALIEPLAALSSLTPDQTQELASLTEKKYDLKSKISSLEHEKSALCALENSWERVFLNALKFKGLKVKDKELTVADLKKLARRWKENVQKIGIEKREKGVHFSPENPRAKKKQNVIESMEDEKITTIKPKIEHQP